MNGLVLTKEQQSSAISPGLDVSLPKKAALTPLTSLRSDGTPQRKTGKVHEEPSGPCSWLLSSLRD
jgi:hypothetical protein